MSSIPPSQVAHRSSWCLIRGSRLAGRLGYFDRGWPGGGSLGKGRDLTRAVMEGMIRRVLGHYDLGELQGTRRVERGFVNETWIVSTTRGRYFLRRRHPTLRNQNIICAQHALIEHLRQAGFPAPEILLAASGETLLVIADECYEIEACIEGVPYDHANPAHFQEAALTLGLYHEQVESFVPGALRGLGDLYGPVLLGANLTDLVEGWELSQDAELTHLVQQLEDHAADLASRFANHGALPHLVIHGDYYAGNLLFENAPGAASARIVGVVDYDKARYQPRIVEVAEALIYFCSPQPAQGCLKHLVYAGFLDWESFARFLRHYTRAITLLESEIHALPDYICNIWLQISLQRLLEKGPRPTEAPEALREVLALGDWAVANTQRMIGAAERLAKGTVE
jgi:Ser/Thr protein kinase RdoA (MazF antagonist)